MDSETKRIGTDDRTIPVAMAADIFLYAEARDLANHYDHLHPLWDEAITTDTLGGRDNTALKRALSYMEALATRSEQDVMHLASVARERFARHGATTRAIAIPSDMDQVRATAGSIWKSHEDLLHLSSALVDMDLCTVRLAWQAMGGDALHQLDETVAWLLDRKNAVMSQWLTRERQILRESMPWLVDTSVALVLQLKGKTESFWIIRGY